MINWYSSEAGVIEKAEFRWESKSTWELGFLRFEENANTLSYMTLYRDNQCFDRVSIYGSGVHATISAYPHHL